MNLKARKWWKIVTPENISHFQAFWTKPTFGSQEKPRRMLKSRHSPTTSATMTAWPSSWDKWGEQWIPVIGCLVLVIWNRFAWCGTFGVAWPQGDSWDWFDRCPELIHYYPNCIMYILCAWPSFSEKDILLKYDFSNIIFTLDTLKTPSKMVISSTNSSFIQIFLSAPWCVSSFYLLTKSQWHPPSLTLAL